MMLYSMVLNNSSYVENFSPLVGTDKGSDWELRARNMSAHDVVIGAKLNGLKYPNVIDVT